MTPVQSFFSRLKVANSGSIARRYFITNGFDGALTMIGLMMGFYAGASADIEVAVKASLGAAIALFMSGSTSAYISESAERKKELQELEAAMMVDLEHSHHHFAARVVPVMVALVNGGAPLFISLFVMSPLLMALAGVALPFNPYLISLTLCLIVIFILGAYLSRISQTPWWLSGLRALSIAVVTLFIIQWVST